MRQVAQAVRQAGYGSLAGAAGLLCVTAALVWATVGETADSPVGAGAAGELPREDAMSGPGPWREACTTCHLAFAPQFLPGESWRSMMRLLPDHFGVVVQLPGETRGRIESWLVANAADGGRSVVGAEVMRRIAPSDRPARVTETRWFRHLHHRISRATWAHPGVLSAANCAACHRDAEQGIFDERSILIPG